MRGAARLAGATSAICAAALAAGGAGCGGSEEEKPTPYERAYERARSLGASQLAGQRVITGFEGTSVPPALRRRIAAGEIGGVILFEGNVEGPGQVARLTRELQAVRRPAGLDAPLLVMADQEGGPVRRIEGPPQGSAAEIGAAGPATCESEGSAAGRLLADAGVNIDLAPVLDVGRAGSAIAAEGRAFGSDPAAVAACGTAFAAGLEAAGVAATAKHFPGLGGATVNTDDAVARIGVSRAGLRTFDQRPFEEFVADGAAGRLVMLSSAIYPAFGPRPAALTPAIAREELRGRLGFEGVTITDALETASTAAVGGPTRFALAAAAAGADLLLFTSLESATQTGAALRSAAARRPATFAGSVARALVLRESLAPPASAAPG